MRARGRDGVQNREIQSLSYTSSESEARLVTQPAGIFCMVSLLWTSTFLFSVCRPHSFLTTIYADVAPGQLTISGGSWQITFQAVGTEVFLTRVPVAFLERGKMLSVSRT